MVAGNAGGRANPQRRWFMSIKGWLLLAGLMGGLAACNSGTGPNAQCSFGGQVGGDRSEFATTGYQVCSESDAMPQ